MECGISWCRGENLAEQTGIFFLELKCRGDGVWIVSHPVAPIFLATLCDAAAHGVAVGGLQPNRP